MRIIAVVTGRSTPLRSAVAHVGSDTHTTVMASVLTNRQTACIALPTIITFACSVTSGTIPVLVAFVAAFAFS